MNKFFTLCFFLAFINSGNLNAQVIYSEDFESGDLPSDWSITTNASDNGWNVSTANDLTSAYWPVMDNGSQYIIGTNDDACNCDKSADYLIMPALDMTNMTSLVLEVDVFFGAQSYQGATEIGTIEVSTDNMQSWTVLEDLHGHGDWDTHIVNLSNYAGQSSVIVAFHYNDDGGWVYGMALDNVKLVVPPTLDAALVEIDSKAFAELSDELTIGGTILNNGVTPIENLEITYTPDGGSPVIETLTGLNIESFEYYNFSLPSPWTPGAEGVYNVDVEITSVNGMIDEDETNNALDFEIEIFPKVIAPNIIDDYLNTIPVFSPINTSSDNLNKPTDLDFFPILAKNELWVINQRTEAVGGSTTTFYNTGEPDQSSLHRVDGNAWHFMSLPTALAFSDNGNFANSAGVQDANHNNGTFTGPALWSSDPDIYAQPSGGNGSHLDMLHGSPFSMGIASDTENAFWVFDGWNNEIVFYDFVDDHGPGNDDHADGIVRRYQDFSVQRDGDIPSHLVLDKTTGWLYIVDNGNDRVLRLDINSGNIGATLPEINEPLAEHSSVVNTTWEVIIDNGLERPCGIEIMENRLLVSDYANGDIIIYDIDNNFSELGRIATEQTGITGIKIGPDGNIWYTNRLTNSVTKVEVGDPVSTNSPEDKNAIFISPNPTMDVINIRLDIPSLTDEVEFMLFDLAGKNVHSGKILDTNHQLDLTSFAKGSYILKVYNNDFTFFEKVVLQ
jgi:hypothetical protein